MNSERCDRLIQAYLDHALSDAELADFETLLLAAPEARKRFWELAEIHGLAGQAARMAWGEPVD